VDSATICRSPLAAADDASGIGLAELRGALAAGALPSRVGGRARGLLDRMAAAEAAVTGLDGSQLTWKRHAALDLLVDLVGAAAAVVWLEPDRITCGPVFVGGEAGPVGNREPVLGATTARLLSGVPIVGGPGGELLTPTGAVLLAGLVDEFGHLPQMVVERCGYGLGRAEVAGRANAVRIWLGRANDLPLSDPTGAVGSSGGEEPCPD
jgi:uncharacterized protein (DUF111 family)